jgi:hypothetical protein
VAAQLEKELEDGGGKVVYKTYLSALNNVLIPFFGKRHINNITPKAIKEFEIWRREYYGKEPAASTITTQNTVLNRIFETAVQHGWAVRNSLPKLSNKGKKGEVRPTFSFAEYRQLVQKMREWVKQGGRERSDMMRELLRDYVLILANTGMRHGTESLNLKWKHIDWWEDQEGHRYIQMTVSGKTGRRTLIARHRTASYLKRIKNRFDDLKDMSLDELFSSKRDEYVFRLRNGTRSRNLHQTFKKMLTELDMLYGTTSDKMRTLYSLRHLYATWELYRGRNIHQLAIQMGTSVGMLEKHYSKLTPLLLADQFGGFREE